MALKVNREETATGTPKEPTAGKPAAPVPAPAPAAPEVKPSTLQTEAATGQATSGTTSDTTPEVNTTDSDGQTGEGQEQRAGGAAPAVVLPKLEGAALNALVQGATNAIRLYVNSLAETNERERAAIEACQQVHLFGADPRSLWRAADEALERKKLNDGDISHAIWQAIRPEGVQISPGRNQSAS